ncbi:MAG: DNA repair protein RecO [Solobacterium sp.]|nr:DNA repair protein RecO [Solobacterium sp.]MBQ1446270.1 DNA repair protein RecO [Solobacterium sp.]MBR2728029.1 DNA repair protein RecO [Solobacterium sp.]
MNDRTDGIVLKQSDYRDSAVLLQVLTREYGLLSFTAKGARKLTSHNALHILPFTESEFLFDYKEGRTLFPLKSSHTGKMFRHVHEDLEAGAAAGVMGELLTRVMDTEQDDSVYDLLLDALELLEKGADSALVLDVFLARMLSILGTAPQVDCCAVTGDTRVAAISVRDGGFISESVARSEGIPLSTREELRAFRLINHASMKDYDILAEYVEDGLSALRVLSAFLREFLSTDLASLRFYYSVRAIE